MAKKSRRRSEELFAALNDAHAHTDDERVRHLLHELHVYGEEITVQNEQLLKAQSELEHARDRYADLYDLAPIGYATIDAQGIITDINIVGAEMLRKGRALFDGMPIFTLIDPRDRPRLRQFIAACGQQRLGPAAQVDVRTKHEPWTDIRLLARSVKTHEHELRYFIAMLDVTDERRLEHERQQALEEAEARADALAKEVGERLAAERRVKSLLERLVTVQEAERRRIALNLHDHLGQQLTALRLTVSALKVEGLPEAELTRRIDTIEGLVEALDQDVDRLAWDLRPVSLDDMGLEPALNAFVKEWSTAHNIAAQVHVSNSEPSRMPHDIESQLYRIVQEALNNVSKHAGASNVSVVIERRVDYALLTIEDDGRGFDPDVSLSARSRHSGMGLIGMQERAALIGGECHIESTVGEGTTVFVRVPLNV